MKHTSPFFLTVEPFSLPNKQIAMAISSSQTRSINKRNIRSISLPLRSHPTTARVEEELNKYKSLEASSSSTSCSISSALSGLDNLYISLEDLLAMSSTKQVISQNRNEKFIDDLLDGSIKLLDACGVMRDMALEIKENVRDLQSVLRRKAYSSVEISIANYNCFRKKVNKDAKKLIAALRQTDNRHVTSPVVDLDQQLCAVIRVLREVIWMNISAFQSLSMFLSFPISNPSKWSLVSKLIHKGSIACDEENASEIESVDAALTSLGCSKHIFDDMKMQIAQRRLKALEICVEELEIWLECLFRRLIKTRSSLLNIISQ